jgi:hypothetical protein
MGSRIVVAAIMMITSGPYYVQTKASGVGAAGEADHPSNGVVELIVKPALDSEVLRQLDPRSVYGPWTGLLQITIRNASRGMVHLGEVAADFEYKFEVLDSSGKAVPQTELGRDHSDLVAHPDPRRPYTGPVSVFDLVPLQEFTDEIDIAMFYRVRPGQAYKIKVRRAAGLPGVDEAGKPLKQVEVSCSVDIPEIGLLR